MWPPQINAEIGHLSITDLHTVIKVADGTWLVTARDSACRVFDVRNQRIEMITFLREHDGFDMTCVSLITTRDEVIELDKMTTKQLKRCGHKIP